MDKINSTVDLRDRLALSRVDAATAISVSPRTIDALLADETSGFPHAKIFNRTVIPVRELEDWLTAKTKVAAK